MESTTSTSRATATTERASTIEPASNVSECQSRWWFDDEKNKTCGYKQFCGDYAYDGLKTYATQQECIQSLSNANVNRSANCTGLWWFDQTNNATCAYKQFCGDYAYDGLRTFLTREACAEKRLNKPVHNIDTGKNYYTIQNAINDPATTKGQTITVDQGIYRENVLVWKSVSIRSASGNPADTILLGPNFDLNIFSVTANNVSISGFSLRAKHSYLHAFFPVPPGGIYVHKADGCIISNNVFSDMTVGVSLEDSSDNIIEDNAFVKTGMQIWYRSENNTVRNNTVNAKPLVYLEGATDQTIADAGQIILVKCKRITITGLTISNTTNAIRLVETNDSTITGNILRDNLHDGLHVSRSDGNTITGNVLKGNERNGIHLFLSDGNTIAGNDLRNNKANGIQVEKSLENTLQNNDIRYSYDGIVVWDISSNNTLTNNTANLNMKGIIFGPFSNHNTATNNTFCKNILWDAFGGLNNTGNDNKCSIAVNWFDNGQAGCKQDCEQSNGCVMTSDYCCRGNDCNRVYPIPCPFGLIYKVISCDAECKPIIGCANYSATTTTTTTSTTSTTAPAESTRLWITRTLPSASNGTTQTVTLAMTVNQTDTPLVVGLTEYYPDGWNVSSVSSGGIDKDGRIEWLFSSLTMPVNDTTITYAITIPGDAQGNYSFSGNSQTEDGDTIGTTGDDTLSLRGTTCSLTGDAPPCGEITLSEVIAMITKWSANQATLSDTVKLIAAWATSK